MHAENDGIHFDDVDKRGKNRFVDFLYYEYKLKCVSFFLFYRI